MNGRRPKEQIQGSDITLPDEMPPRLQESLLLVAGAVVVGLLTGLVGVGFLYALNQGNAWRMDLVGVLHSRFPTAGAVLFAGTVGLCAAVAAWMVQRFAPNAVGSGVPYVEKILRGPGHSDHRNVLPVKFFGGLLALSCGLILGREGPLVQMGAVIGERVGRRFRRAQAAWKPLMAAGAGAGLATAFNAPVGGTVFILEEVLRKVTPLSFILATTAVCSSVFLQRAVFGMGLDFQVSGVVAGPVWNLPVYLIIGAAIGCLGPLYNKLIFYTVSARCPLQRVPIVPRALTIGLVIGAVAWYFPNDASGGDALTRAVLVGQGGVFFFLSLAAVRFFLGPLSYVAGTPGGLFAPIVALGALLGGFAGLVLHQAAPALVPSPLAFAVAGMAAFFTACIRAPLTGIVICLEMTGCYELFLPMLATCLGAYLLPTLLHSEPLYDGLAKIR
jgi:CIC family chloride channel protein